MAIVLGGGGAGQTISLSILAQNPNKGLEISRETRSERGEEGTREDTGSLDKGRRRDAFDNGKQKRPVGMRSQSRERTVSPRRQ